MQRSLVLALESQKQALIKKNPELAAYFISIDFKGQKIPFLPIGCFRTFHVFSKDELFKTFFSSGSTSDVRARHSYSKNGLGRYAENSSIHFRDFLKSLGVSREATVISLIPTSEEWPQSSLASMIAMFKSSGINVVYEGYAKLQNLSNDIVVFGTSFHHLLVSRNLEFEALLDVTRGRRVVVIDTGGTKGKTRSFELNEVHEHIQATYRLASECQVASEYGMCELASQAWSKYAPHNGWFRTNDSLTPVLIDLDTRKVMDAGDKPGFLAFIDRGNEDSFMAIITEDLAMMNCDMPNSFKLIGRAPDASVKGCSLNVKDGFQTTSGPSDLMPIGLGSINYNEPTDIREILVKILSLSEDIWDDSSKSDLVLALESVIAGKTDLEHTRRGQRVLMILSANIPITFLYPAFVFMERGVKELHFRFPSLRPSDLHSDRVRNQIKTLLQIIAPFLSPMTLYVHDDKDVSLSRLEEFDTVLIFGSDDTIATFETALANAPRTQMIGLGSVANAYQLKSSDSAETLAQRCSRWLGRGCLTPVALVGIDPCEGFIGKFCRSFEEEFSKRISQSGLYQPFAHRHLVLEVEGILVSLGLDPSKHIHRSASTFVIDLRTLSELEISRSKFPLDRAGAGLVFLICENQLNTQAGLRTFPVDPGYSDPHMDRVWTHWI